MISRLKKALCFLVPTHFKEDLHICQSESPKISEIYQDFLKEKPLTERVQNLDEEKIRELLSFCEKLYNSEEERQHFIENKAAILSGFSGTISAAILTLSILFVDTNNFLQASLFLRILSVVFFVLVLSLLVSSIFFSSRILGVWTYSTLPSEAIFELEESSILAAQKKRAQVYFYSYLKNQAVNDRKVDNYKLALSFFRLSMVFMVLLSISIGTLSFSASSNMAEKSSEIAPLLNTPLPSYTATQVVSQTPIATSTPIPSATNPITP